MIDWKQSRIHETLKLINKKVEILYEAPTAAQGIVLICHPHPLFQGSMHNKVVVTLAKAARQAGFYIKIQFFWRWVD